MQPPNWSQCTEEEAWRFVAWHLEGEGIRSVLVGGAVVAIYTEGLYRSGDLDMVPDELGRNQLAEALAKIGFAFDELLNSLSEEQSSEYRPD